MKRSVACLLGAGFSFVAGVPLARDLIAMSERSSCRFRMVREHYEKWQEYNPGKYPEQYMGLAYTGRLGQNPPKWEWITEYISSVIASAGTPPASLNRNPRYSNRLNRPILCASHQSFWRCIFGITKDVSVITTNYDILVERVLRHRPMERPPSPGCFYGGLPRPQILRGAAQPFSRLAPERTIEMTGAIPVFKLHGSLNWTLEGESLVVYQDMRAAFRHGGNAAIIPPVTEKFVPTWLQSIWRDAEVSLRRSDVWVVCGYSMPAYDVDVLNLLKAGGMYRPVTIILLSPEADELMKKCADLLPTASVICLPGLPEGIELLGRHLYALL